MMNSRSNSKKVAIIGAGITGLYLAWKLSERGNFVEVFERRNAIGKEACSGLFSERIIKFIPQSRELIQNEINFVLIHFPKKTLRVNFGKKFFVMSHAELDRLAAGLAENAGAKINMARTFHAGGVFDNFDRVIGCDGANSEVRKHLGLPEPNCRLGILGFIPQENNSNFVETWPVRQGFIWKIPRGQETEYGIIAKPGEARKIFDEFLEKSQLKLERVLSALIPQGFVIPKNSRITLCGDSVGLTKPWSGGGVIWGLTAARILLKNFPDVVKYRQEAQRFFLPEIVLSKIISRLVYFLGFNFPWILPNNTKMEGDYAFRNHHGRESAMGQE